MELLDFFNTEIQKLSESGVKLTVLGDLSQFDKDIREKIKKASLINKKYKINLIMAINYGARQEIKMQFKKFVKVFK